MEENGFMSLEESMGFEPSTTEQAQTSGEEATVVEGTETQADRS